MPHRREPAQRGFGRPARPVFGAERNVPAEPRDLGEDMGEVHLAPVGRSPVGDRGELDVADLRQKPGKAAGQVALGRLHVIAVEEQPEARRADLPAESRTLVRARQEVAGMVDPVVEDLQPQRDALPLGEYPLEGGPLSIGRDAA